jgi:hypothetical protein
VFWHPAADVQHHFTCPDLLEHCDGLLVTEPMQSPAIHCQYLVSCNTQARH